jgi:hypothetical protein
VSFKDIALPLAARGIKVIPCQPLAKRTFLRGGPERGTLDEAQILAWDRENPNYNVGSLGTLDTNSLFDCDIKGLVAQIEKETGQKLPPTFTVKSANKGTAHLYFAQTERSRALGNKTHRAGEVRGDNEYVVGPGSEIVCDDGTKRKYEIYRDLPFAPFPDFLVDWVLANSGQKKSIGTGAPDQDALTVLKGAYLRSGRVWSALKAARKHDLKLNGDHSTILAFANFLNNSWEEDREDRDGIQDILETIWDECGTSSDGGRTEDEVEDILDHAFAKDRKPWVIRDESGAVMDPPYATPCFVWSSRRNIPPLDRQYSDEPEWQQKGPLWVFTNETDFALFKHRVEQTPAWAYAAEWKDPEGWPELPADYESWKASQTVQEDPRLLTHAALKAVRNATPNPEIVEGVITENSVNILVGDSGLGKTPFVVQLAVCIALGVDFLGQKTVQKKVMMVDYENAEALVDVVGHICEHLGLPADFEMDPKWFRIVQNVDAGDVLKLAREFKPAFVVVDSLRGFCPKAEAKPETAGVLITELQGQKTSFLLMHHVRKNSTEKRDKRQPLEKEERVLDWLEAAAGARALINQTHTRIAIDHVKADNADLVLRGFFKGRGEFGPWKLARNYSEQHGEPIGYNRLRGTALLDIEQSAFFDALPKDRPMSYKEIQHYLSQSEGQITRFLAACDNARVVVTAGKRKTRSRRYTFLPEKGTKTAQEIELEESVRKAFK